MPDDAPTFTLIEERSDEGSADIALRFPNGYSDTLTLRRIFDNEEDEMAGADYHYYRGELAGDPEACVTATGRLGSEAMDFSIASDRLDGSRYDLLQYAT